MAEVLRARRGRVESPPSAEGRWPTLSAAVPHHAQVSPPVSDDTVPERLPRPVAKVGGILANNTYPVDFLSENMLPFFNGGFDAFATGSAQCDVESFFAAMASKSDGFSSFNEIYWECFLNGGQSSTVQVTVQDETEFVRDPAFDLAGRGGEPLSRKTGQPDAKVGSVAGHGGYNTASGQSRVFGGFGHGFGVASAALFAGELFDDPV